MGQRGPAPKSKKELAKRGSWRAKDRADDLEMPNKAPTAPTALSREAKAEWKRLVALLEPRGVLSEGDRIGLTVLCELWAEDRDLGKLLNKLPTGTNDWKRTGYGGPCPPIGRHRYFFKLYALDTLLGDLGAPTKADLERAMEGHILARTELMGTYERPENARDR